MLRKRRTRAGRPRLQTRVPRRQSASGAGRRSGRPLPWQTTLSIASLLTVGAVLLFVARCPAPQAPKADANATMVAPPIPGRNAAHERYVSAPSLDCHASQSRTASVVTSLSTSQRVSVAREEGDWSLVESPAGQCWVTTAFLSATAPQPVTLPTALASPTRSARSARLYSTNEEPQAGFQCGAKRVCGQMNSCAEANYYLNHCGLTRLDRDGDGVPCESIC